jgi:hypothetical protein
MSLPQVCPLVHTGMCDTMILHWLVKTSKLQTRSSILHDICNLFIWRQVKHKLAEGGIDLIRDPRLQPEFPPDIFTTLTDLALNCTMYERLERPTMKVCNLSDISCSWKSQSLSRTRLKWSLPSQACCSLNEDTIDHFISYVSWVPANIMTESFHC